ncbi:RICIN domain-containing protein [Chromobacterium haemolyticum]|uniref:RICIN domain-containing protein n=1 Tax=Chromobacterium haemolyticum TaxID=394935 RepID=UPI002954E898|nr:RICIN domain-containing protein [Chromobacterium haemolyticum]WON84494.1 RICIN domain-containing protein [Chromobacterium haemolyticum]
MIQWPCSGLANQRFSLKADGAGSYSLVGAQAGKCVDVANSSVQAGQQLIQWACHGGANQRWRLLAAE